jgi:hypothetical protein
MYSYALTSVRSMAQAVHRLNMARLPVFNIVDVGVVKLTFDPGAKCMIR